MDPLLASGLISGAQTASNAILQGGTNKKQRQWMEGMYAKQRTDALADWQMQANYNSPSEQMARLKAAGLNPNLVYGNGATAEMGTAPRASSPGSYSPQAPQVDLTSGLQMGYDIRMKNAQMDQLQAQQDVMKQDILLKAAQTQKTLTDTDSTSFDVKMKNDLKSINLEMADQALTSARAKAHSDWEDLGLKENLRQISDSTIKENIDAAKAQARNVLNQASASDHLEKRVLTEIDNLAKDRDLKQFNNNLNRLGVNASDPTWLRIITQLFGQHVKTGK